MQPATNYRIYQRDERGGADVLLSGTLPESVSEHARVVTRVCRESDNLCIIQWTDCACENRRWHITLRLPQGGLYRLETFEWEQGRRLQNIRHVGVGELFLLAGQSNMSGYGNDSAHDPSQLGVHCYYANGVWDIASHPLNDSVDTIYPENEEYGSMASPALAFARQLQRALNVPIGLIPASQGGSPLSAWHPEEDGRLTRGMLRRLEATGKVGGIVWYQGCNEASSEECATYLPRFTRMVELWRGQLGPLPVITVQLNRWSNPEGGERGDRFWGTLREAQRQAARRIADVYITPTTDLPTSDAIHNSAGGNVMLGERMADIYLQARWGLTGQHPADVERVIRVDDTHLLVEMSPDTHVCTMDNRVYGMDAEDKDGLIPCTDAFVHEKGLLLTLARPCAEEVCLHILWRATPPAYLPRSRHGMPMLSCYGVKAQMNEV